MSLPLGFNRAKQLAYQRTIDEITGTTDGRSRVKLKWGPEALTWLPHRLEHEPLGYQFPQFYAGKDAQGNYRSAERWTLLQRIEWEQFGPTWEAIRYKKHDGSVWDLKGPCPTEKYVALRCHVYHNGTCCSCTGTECKCDVSREICWGCYVEPNEDLLNWIRRVAWESRQDPDVDPFADVRFFEATQAQRELKSKQATAIEKSKQPTELDTEAVDLFLRAPHSVNVRLSEAKKQLPAGFKKDKKRGLYLLN